MKCRILKCRLRQSFTSAVPLPASTGMHFAVHLAKLSF